MKNQVFTIFFIIATSIVLAQTTNTDQLKNQLNKQQTALFEENKGQMKDQYWKPRPDVLFYGNSEGMNFYLRNNGMSYQLSRVESWKEEEDFIQKNNINKDEKKKVPNQIGTYRVDAEWQNYNTDFTIEKGNALSGYNNYYNVPEGVEPALNVKQYESLTLKNIWNGVDIHYYGTDGFLETDYIVAPGADYRQIEIKINGAELSIDETGNLVMKTPFGEIREGQLKVYQENKLVDAYWKISKQNIVSFEIPNYNSQLAMRIDPLTRVWGTYYGGTGDEGGYSSSIDLSGNVYLGGHTQSSNSIASGWHQNIYGGGTYDAFLVKFNSMGIRQWGTFYGGTGFDISSSSTTDIFDNIYMAGTTSSTANIALGGHQNMFGGGFQGYQDAFLVKFNSDGVRQWGTYYGGTGNEYGYSTTADAIGNVYLTGNTSSTNNIALGGHQNIFAGGNTDGFIVKFNNAGVRQWGTYYGGNGNGTEDVSSIISDVFNNIYVSGGIGSLTNISNAGYQNTFGGGAWDAFLVKFNSAGVRQWGTYYGGIGEDFGDYIGIDGLGNLFLSGRTTSTNNIASGGHQNIFGGGGGGNMDAFLVKFNSAGVRQWGTYYGGTGAEGFYGTTTDGAGNIYIVGTTSSTTNIAAGGYQNNYGGGTCDAFLVKFNSAGVRQWSSYYGGIDEDRSNAVALDHLGRIYLVGHSLSINNIASGGHQNITGGSFDAFLVKFKQTQVTGFVWQDLNTNCVKETSETGIVNGISLVVQPGNYVTQSIDGVWSLDSLPAGNYTITINTTNLNWFSTCSVSQTFAVINPNGFTNGPNFGLISNPCTSPDVSIYAPFLRRCFNNQKIYVSACNQSTATNSLISSYVDVELDPLIIVNSATLPYTSLGNNTFRFQTGNINIGQCVNFNLSTTISCNALLNQTLCMDATLYPIQACAFDTAPSTPPGGGGGGSTNSFPQPCTLPWDQSSLSVDGWCQGDSVYFSITNNGSPGGGDMECYAPMWVTVDGVLTITDSIMISGGQTIILSYFGNGQTWILNAEQHPLHPGNSHPNAHVEACGDTTNWVPDNVNDFPLDDADPVVDIYCGLVRASYDPNDKKGYPIGQTNQNFIQPNQQLQYVIRFQNTGTDTAFTVVVRDTLDIDLNIFTVTPGVSSHNYTFRMYGPRVLEWTFNNINLPDSTTNLAGSNGFITFHVEQVPNLAPGTLITNDADIYFDFNSPITTNTTTHRIYQGFVSVAGLEEQIKKTTNLIVYPNPTNGEITIKIDDIMSTHEYRIYDQLGREVKKGKLQSNKSTLNLDLQSGIYFLAIGNRVAKIQVIN